MALLGRLTGWLGPLRSRARRHGPGRSGTTARPGGFDETAEVERLGGERLCAQIKARVRAEYEARLGAELSAERERLQQQVQAAAFVDPLTGMPNRAAFAKQLTDRFSSADVRADGADVAMLFCDLDGFKRVNDTSGHSAGDVLLAEAAARVRSAVRPDDLAARLGGDEFAVLLAPGTSQEAAVEVAEQVADALAGSYQVLGRAFRLSASIGVARGGAARGPGALVRGADLAMYRAKDAGRGRVVVFEDAMLQEFRNRVDLEQRLHQAIQDECLGIAFQPVVDLRSGAVVSVEALVRWERDGEVVMDPADLVELAESVGQITAIGGWVLQCAVAQASEWASVGYPVQVAVNLSVQQLADPDLVSVVNEALRRFGVPPDRLTLEITETVLLEQAEDAISTLERLCGLGVRLAVDDFGTGYSSLGYLRRLPVSQLKVDRGFLRGFGQLADVTALLRSMVGLGHDLGLTVVVEGIESARHLRLLRALGVENGQGYLFSRPLDAPALLEFLARGPFLVDVADDVDSLPRASGQWGRVAPWTSPEGW